MTTLCLQNYFCCFKSNKIADRPSGLSANGNNNAMQVKVAQPPAKVVAEKQYDIHKEGLDYDNCDAWVLHCPNAAGRHQSPVEIMSKNCLLKESLLDQEITIMYMDECFNKISNNGHTFVVSCASSESSLCEIQVPIFNENCFKCEQFHMHWGSDDSYGSEHMVDGRSFSAELHFVHWDTKRYSSFAEAAKAPNHEGLLVVGIFVKIGQENSEFSKIISYLKNIQLADQSIHLNNKLNIKGFFPNDLTKYWMYDGSLTTPPCNESVKWLVLKDTIQISSAQLNSFRSMYSCRQSSECCEDNKIKKNCRTCCPLNDRKVFKSFV